MPVNHLADVNDQKGRPLSPPQSITNFWLATGRLYNTQQPLMNHHQPRHIQTTSMRAPRPLGQPPTLFHSDANFSAYLTTPYFPKSLEEDALGQLKQIHQEKQPLHNVITCPDLNNIQTLFLADLMNHQSRHIQTISMRAPRPLGQPPTLIHSDANFSAYLTTPYLPKNLEEDALGQLEQIHQEKQPLHNVITCPDLNNIQTLFLADLMSIAAQPPSVQAHSVQQQHVFQATHLETSWDKQAFGELDSQHPGKMTAMVVPEIDDPMMDLPMINEIDLHFDAMDILDIDTPEIDTTEIDTTERDGTHLDMSIDIPIETPFDKPTMAHFNVNHHTDGQSDELDTIEWISHMMNSNDSVQP
jgi:hypothetical protein